MGKTVKVGVIGLGQWGRQHLRVYHHIEGVELVGVVDRDFQEAMDLAKRYGTKAYAHHRELLGKVEAVSIVVPTVLHYAIAKECIEAGVHVLLEKPMTTTMEEASHLVELAHRHHVVLLIGHVERFKPAVERFLELSREPLFVHGRRIRPYDPARSMDVGVILDLMIHDLDILLTLVRSPVERVSAVGVRIYNSHEDLAACHLTFRNGCVAQLVASRISAAKAAEIEVTMEDRVVSLDYLQQTITVRRKDGETRRYVVKGEEPLRNELTHFIRCVRGEVAPRVPGEEGMAALELAELIRGQMKLIAPSVAVGS
ncbi:MAG: Gfo/Idh/MocA family oxidoreductase [Armatimonadota bacterium]|nr:Gfo/Idh/MocA family oxidoreductase [Armatimonadota bacterium]